MSYSDSHVSESCAIAVMAKASMPGRVKTRLMPVVSAELAADLNTAFLRDIADNLLRAASHVYISPQMAFAPAGSEPFFARTLPPGIGLIETVAPDFGQCLAHPIDVLLGRGYGSACVLNSDSPTLPVAYIIAAATVLAADDDRAVIGPSIDGGYYLLGLKRPHPELFQGIDWSTERVFAQTLERARAIDLPVTVLPSWYDVDDAGSLQLLIGELFEERPFRAVGPQPATARHSRRVLAQLLRIADRAQVAMAAAAEVA